MLPFLQPKKMASTLVIRHKPDGSNEPEGEEGEPNHALLSAAEDLISAIHSKDASAVASALKAAIEMQEGEE